MKRLRSLFQRDNAASADVARERLMVMISQDRLQRNQPDFLPRLQKELIEVILRYTKSSQEDIQISYHSLPQQAQLELNVTWPSRS
ncbi:cell division topological specificity factor MinE [Oceanospirillum multiglobuliferum]|uniref:Cell division topological specificity factor n=1 Tax=Oceanospirillum multiglobuliferum TaxID=64969 RepID=A0A1T4S105_9GAMM|nr:cell division topological specificity factor MinE [Oceanospirillum multiglobuliferum]OPX54521.1 cell division topological specificity factor MinE [Oceanospirillum multiglobuliferum]SKA21847.1 cell division topological specificity factor MinE [Oceanospirillum multiglobuliferum]